MKGKLAKERIIYDNYDLWEKYPDADLIEMARECGWIDEDEEPTESDINEWRHWEDENNWECTKEDLTRFFEDETVGFFGEVGRWDGVYSGADVGEFWKLFNDATEDCWYWKIYDENGHLYLTCSHHDGTCHFEIRLVSDQGRQYLENWEYSWNDKRKPSQIYNQLYKRYSTLPRYAQKMWGCKAREYEPITKGGLIDMLNNQAKSNYA